MLTRLAVWWLRRHRPDDTPEHASLMWVWSKRVSLPTCKHAGECDRHEFVEFARPIEWSRKHGRSRMDRAE